MHGELPPREFRNSLEAIDLDTHPPNSTDLTAAETRRELGFVVKELERISQDESLAGKNVVETATQEVPVETLPEQNEILTQATELELLEEKNETNTVKWTPGEELPKNSAVLGFRDNDRHFYAHAPTTDESFRLAQDFGMKNPEKRVFFDNSRESSEGEVERVGAMEFDKYGQLKHFEAQAKGEDGNPVIRIGPEMLNRVAA